jgi:hypothetical protein
MAAKAREMITQQRFRFPPGERAWRSGRLGSLRVSSGSVEERCDQYRWQESQVRVPFPLSSQG